MSYTPLKTVREALDAILESVQQIKVLGAVKGILQDLRVSIVNTPPVTIASGTVTTVSSVSVVVNQTQVWGYNASAVIMAQTNATANLANIANISITP